MRGRFDAFVPQHAPAGAPTLVGPAMRRLISCASATPAASLEYGLTGLFRGHARASSAPLGPSPSRRLARPGWDQEDAAGASA